MQEYGALFARVYNERWAGFARHIAPRIRTFYEDALGRTDRSLLDLCCGTGQMAAYFLDAGYKVVGLDLSADMLHYAQANAAAFIESGQARFIQGNASNFHLDESVGLVVSTYDALNHLPDTAALQSCFTSVRRALVADGLFVFDLNTRRGLARWNSVNVTDEDDLLLVNRGIYDGGERAYTRISGFVRDEESGQYDRFAETFYNTVFDLDDVLGWLGEAGFTQADIAADSDLAIAAPDPQSLGRAWFVAR